MGWPPNRKHPPPVRAISVGVVSPGPAAVGHARCRPEFLEAVAALAAALHLPVVAEGVETVQQVTVLRRLGFALAQGFYFGRPQTPEELVRAMRRPVVGTRPVAAR